MSAVDAARIIWILGGRDIRSVWEIAEPCLVTEGLSLVDRIERHSSPVSRSTDA